MHTTGCSILGFLTAYKRSIESLLTFLSSDLAITDKQWRPTLQTALYLDFDVSPLISCIELLVIRYY